MIENQYFIIGYYIYNLHDQNYVDYIYLQVLNLMIKLQSQ